MSQKIENLLLFLTLLLLPTTLGWHFWPQFAHILSFPINYLSPTIYYFDLLVALLLLVSLRNGKVSRLSLNLLFIFVLAQVISLLPLANSPLGLGAGIVRIEQYILVGLFGVYLSSKKLDLKIIWIVSLYAASIIIARLTSPIEREQFLQIGINIFLNSPILGIGLNNLIPYAVDHLLLAPERSLVPIHNIYLLTLVETGIVGFLGLFVLILVPLLKLKSLPLLLVWFLIIMVGMFDHFFLTEPAGYRVLFLIWGLSLQKN